MGWLFALVAALLLWGAGLWRAARAARWPSIAERDRQRLDDERDMP